MKRNWIYSISLICVLGMFVSCRDLDVTPIDDDELTSKDFLSTPEAYQQLLAKIYAGLVLTGNQGPAGSGDVQGIDEGFSSYLRSFYYLSEMTTDELVVGWNDDGIRDLHNQNWSASNQFAEALYSRIFYNITLANEFIRTASGSSDPIVQGYVLEARFMRALSYWHALDLYRNVPFITDADAVGAFLPTQATPQELFDYIESELLAIEPNMAATGNAEYYARADQGAARMLLAKLYLNAEVYIGEAHNAEAATYAELVADDPSYALEANYDHVFAADNHLSNEIIFHVYHDGAISRSFGGVTMIINGGIGGSMTPLDYGVTGAWGGTRTTAAFVDKFEDDVIDDSFTEATAVDSRANFYTQGQDRDIEDIAIFTNGFALTKFKNVTSGGANGSNGEFVDTDFPLFRLADAYLMYAEATLRGASTGDAAKALGYVNELRERAYGNTSGNITTGELTLDFILDERARELYQECHRRTDLVRFGQFSNGTYLWPWKGGVADGTTVSSTFDVFPIPASDLSANPNLVQNDGY